MSNKTKATLHRAVACIAFLLLVLAQTATAQKSTDWREVAQRSSNFYEIKAAFLKANAGKLKEYQKEIREAANKVNSGQPEENEEEERKFADVVHYMRWAEWYEPRIYESNGDLNTVGRKDAEARLLAAASPAQAKAAAGASWAIIGPINQTNNMFGNGRINNLRVDPTNPNTLYACTPASQLFKSTNGGTTWVSISNGIPSPGITDMAIDPTAPNTLYAVTGDGDQSLYHPFSAGVYKSTNGGATWAATGINLAQGNGTGLTSILINPVSPDVVLVSGTSGILRSVNGGASFTLTSNFSIQNLAFKPGNPSIVYAGSKTGGIFLRSVDGGATWAQITAGLPVAGTAARLAIDVSPVNPDYVSVLATNPSHNMFGFYFSVDGGLTFKRMSTTPNIPAGQGWYDLAVAADPVAAATVYACGVDVFRSTDTGKTWTNLTNVYTVPVANSHPDCHDLTFSGSTLYLSNDGGVYKSTNAGTSWSNISANLSIAQPYGIGLSGSTPNIIIAGHQDNGTNLTTDLTNWRQVFGGDGMISFIDRTNNNLMFGSTQNGGIRRSVNGGNSWSSALNGISGSGYWVTPYLQDPVVASTIYTGFNNVYKSTNSGAGWVAIGPSWGTASVRWIDVDRSNNQIIYAIASGTTLYKTSNGGVTWATAASGLPGGGLLHVHVDVNNPNTLYVSVASYNGNSVYISTNAGASWALWATGLPNVPANTITTVMGSPGDVYCGNDVGVYFRSTGAASWSAYSTGLPTVPVRDLEIYYPTSTLRAATFGRSVWESPLNSPTCSSEFPGRIAYVNVAATGGANKGNSWADAYLDLQSALNAATSCGVTQIWVAGGIYKATTTSDRNIAFAMRNNTTIYGGFPNSGTPTLAQRNAAANPTILSGDIGTELATDNSYHVISNAVGLNNTAVLDGFIISGGYADGSGTGSTGGGLYNNGQGTGIVCSPRITNCTFQNNYALATGGAAYNEGNSGGASSPVFYNCRFINNRSGNNAGAVHNNGTGGTSSPLFTNCIFQGNTAVNNGGAILNNGTAGGNSSPVIFNCSFQKNTAAAGGALYNMGSSGTCVPAITNSALYANGGSSTFFNSTASIAAKNCLFEPTIINYTNVSGNVTSINTPFVLPTDMHTMESSAGIDAGLAAGAPAYDIDSTLRTAIPDIGAYENGQSCMGATKNYYADTIGNAYQWQKDDGAGYADIANGTLYANVTTNKLTVIAPANAATGNRFRCRVTTGDGTVYSTEIILRFYNRWQGTVSNNWLTPANWSCGVIPDQYTDVIVPSAKTIYPLLNVSGTIRKLLAENGSSITVKTGSSLIITGVE